MNNSDYEEPRAYARGFFSLFLSPTSPRSARKTLIHGLTPVVFGFKSDKVYATKHFNKQLKKLTKHNSGLIREVWGALFSFDKKFHISVGNYIYKIRLKGNQKGKSGGYRMYIYVFEVENVLTPICIYSKSDRGDMSEEDLNRHAGRVLEELKLLI